MNHDFLKNIDNTWSLFLDRDGVINKRIVGGYVKTPEQFEFLPGVLESLAFFASVFNRIIVITNQQGVGKGIMTEAELIEVNNHMINQIGKTGGRIDSVYYCTDVAESPHNCRKPSPKMADKAIRDFPEIDTKKSIMVGDSITDIEFGNNTGMKTIFVMSDNNDEITTGLANYQVTSLYHLKNLINKQ
ncbi:MAG: HAD family hydrolase [Bacteroidetes bacterium]|nr:HAD family hydrolase [Bacteroidota bacterium]